MPLCSACRHLKPAREFPVVKRGDGKLNRRNPRREYDSRHRIRERRSARTTERLKLPAYVGAESKRQQIDQKARTTFSSPLRAVLADRFFSLFSSSAAPQWLSPLPVRTRPRPRCSMPSLPITVSHLR